MFRCVGAAGTQNRNLFKQYIKRQGSLPVCSQRCFLFGLSCIGKTSAKRCLTGVIKHILPNEIIPSTGINMPLTVRLHRPLKSFLNGPSCIGKTSARRHLMGEIKHVSPDTIVTSTSGIDTPLHCSLTSFLIDPSYVGKTSARLRLTRELKHISPGEIIPSTGIDAPLTVQLHHPTEQSSILLSQGWHSQGLDEQCRTLCSYVINSSTHPPKVSSNRSAAASAITASPVAAPCRTKSWSKLTNLFKQVLSRQSHATPATVQVAAMAEAATTQDEAAAIQDEAADKAAAAQNELTITLATKFIRDFSIYVQLMEQLARECTTLQSSVNQITKLVNELRWILYAQVAQCSGYLKHEIMTLTEQLLELARGCTTLQLSVMLVHEVISMYLQKVHFLGDPRLMQLLMKECTTLQSNYQFELLLEYVLKAGCQDLTPVKQTIKHLALQPLNIQPLFLTKNYAVLLPPSNKFESFTDPHPVVLNNRKPDNFWPFGVTAFDVFSNSTPKRCFQIDDTSIVIGVLNRLVLCNCMILHNI